MFHMWKICSTYQEDYELPYYVLTLGATLGSDAGNPLINVFTYDTTELLPDDTTAALLADAFFGEFLDVGADLLAILPEELVFNSVVITAPQDPTVLYVGALDSGGEGVGDHDGAWTAYEWWSPRTVGNIKAGFKRFGPVLKANNVDGVFPAGSIAAVNAVAASLSTTFNLATPSGDHVLTPCVVKRIPYETPSGNVAYRLPNGTDPYNRSLATNWAYKRLTTQNTRKR